MHPSASIIPNRPLTKRQKLDILVSQCDQEYNTFRSLYRDLNDWILPVRGRFFITDVNRGDRRNLKIIDSTATTAARTLRAGMVSGVTSPARRWFKLETSDPVLNRMPKVKDWLFKTAERMNKAFTKSNYYQTKPLVYGDIGTFGTAAFSMLKDFNTVIHTQSFPIGSFRIAKDSKGRVNVFVREFRMTIAQLIEMFGEPDKSGRPDWSKFSTYVRNQYEQAMYQTWVDVVHVVKPNENYNPRMMESKYKKFMSCYYEKGWTSGQDGNYMSAEREDVFLSEKGFDYFPILAPRWEVAGEDVYGTDCPGITSLGDVKQLQWGEKRIAEAIERVNKPPMKGPTSLRNQKTSILPGDMTFTDERDGQKGMTPIYQIDPRINEMEMKQSQLRGRIDEVYYKNLFLMMVESDRRQITAREIDERAEEKLIALGPVMEQVNQDDLDPSIDLLFNYMVELGMIDDPPEELQGRPLNVEYISMMAQAQKMVGIGGLERAAGFVGQLVAPFPDAGKKLNVHKLIDAYGDVLSLPPGVIRSDDEVAEMAMAEQQAQMQQQRMMMMAEGAKAANQLANAPMDTDSALSRLVEQTAGGLPTA